MTTFLVVALLMLFSCLAYAREQFPGQYAQVDQKTRDWFNNQTIPGSKTRCCSDADGVYAEEDIRDGHYWVRFVAKFTDQTGAPGEAEVPWMQVPDPAVIEGANNNGAPVVWWTFNDGAWGIKCFAPGAKL
jgi:hypothetical protein